MPNLTKTENNIFLLRFFGEGITPESFTAKELGNILIKFEEAILAIVESKFPELESTDVKISCVEIEARSESIAFSTLDSPVKVQEACLYYGNAINKGFYTDLPDRSYGSFKYIYDQAKQKECSIEYKHQNNTIFTIDSTSFELTKPESVKAKSDTVIYGELKKIGGETPRVWVELHTGEMVSFKISIEHARQLSPKLYTTVGLKGEAILNIVNKSIIGFKLYDIIDYKPGNLTLAFEKLKQLTSGVWDNFKTNEDINKELGRI